MAAAKANLKGKIGRPKNLAFPIPSYVKDLAEPEQEIYWQFVRAAEEIAPDLSVFDKFHLHLAALEYILLQRSYGDILTAGKQQGKFDTSHFSNLYKSLEFCNVGRKERQKQQPSGSGLDEDMKELAGIS